MLVILTDIDGYYDKNPHTNKDAKFLKFVNKINKNLLKDKQIANSQFATGGIVTKLKAGDFLLENNKQMFLTSGFNLNDVNDFLINKKHTKGTLFKG
jgi:glutamate 5-kinase